MGGEGGKGGVLITLYRGRKIFAPHTQILRMVFGQKIRALLYVKTVVQAQGFGLGNEALRPFTQDQTVDVAAIVTVLDADVLEGSEEPQIILDRANAASHVLGQDDLRYPAASAPLVRLAEE